MRIIESSNFDLDDYPEKDIATGITDEKLAQTMADTLNASTGPDTEKFYRVVPDDYVLGKGFEP